MEQTVFTCSSCGGNLVFEPGVLSLKCPYCGTVAENEAAAPPEIIEELDFEKALSSFEASGPTEEVRIVECPACRAELTFRGTETTASCVYCGTHIQAGGESHKAMLPQYLLPFGVKKSEAMETFRSWIGKGFFAPSSLSKLARVSDPLSGIYFPFWTYDSNTSTTYTGRRGEYYYVNEQRTDKDGKVSTVRVRHTRWHSARGSVSRAFDDLLIAAGRSIPETLTRKLDQWDFSQLLSYAPSYLSGFKAESYSIDLRNGFEAAKKEMSRIITGDVKRDIGGDEQQISSMNTRYDHITFKYILLPIWTMKYKFKDKYYQVVVNAQTGEIEGQKPVSALKIALTAAVVLLVGGGIYFAFQYFGG
jgi:predicted RNA-binding Zn-ribbon protein involved in translation (DUF1610 family)